MEPEELADMIDENSPEAPRTSTPERMGGWEITKEIVDVGSKLFLIVAVFIGYLEYNAANLEQQRERAFEFVENWETGNFQKASDFVARRVVEIDAATPSSLTGEPRKNYISAQLLRESAADPEFDEQILKLYYFYSKVGLCAQEKICDRGILYDFFHTSASRFLNFFDDYTNRKHASGQSDFASFALDFAKQSGRPD